MATPAPKPSGGSAMELLATIHPEPVNAILGRLEEHRQWSGERASPYARRSSTRRRQPTAVDPGVTGDRWCSRLTATSPIVVGLEAERARLAAIVESSDDAIIGMDLDGTITAWNQAAERIVRLRRRGSHRTIDSPGGAPTIDKTKSPGCSIESRAESTSRISRRFAAAKTEPVLPASLSLSPIRDQAGRVTGAAKIARDITERQRASQHAALARRSRCRARRNAPIRDDVEDGGEHGRPDRSPTGVRSTS